MPSDTVNLTGVPIGTMSAVRHVVRGAHRSTSAGAAGAPGTVDEAGAGVWAAAGAMLRNARAAAAKAVRIAAASLAPLALPLRPRAGMEMDFTSSWGSGAMGWSRWSFSDQLCDGEKHAGIRTREKRRLPGTARYSS